MNFAVFTSGHGSNLQAIINAVQNKKIRAKLKLVVSDKAGAFALKRARKAKVPTVILDTGRYPDRASFDRAAVEQLRLAHIDFVVLAGFMRILSPYMIQQYAGKILNVHPALLPSFRGAHAIRDAFDFGVRVTGVTIHFVDEQVDHGAIIMQEAVKIEKRDTLASLEKKIHSIEHRLYPQAIDLFARGKLRVTERKVFS